MDDQVARAMVAEDAGAMIVVKDLDEVKLAMAIESMLDSVIRAKMVDAAIHLGEQNGANELAESLS